MNNFSLTGAALNIGVIPLTPPSKPVESAIVTVSNLVNIGTVGEPRFDKRLTEIPKADPTNVESILRMVLEFEDACHLSRLAIITGPLKFARFRDFLQGTMRDKWDQIKIQQQTETLTTFTAAQKTFLQHYIKPTDLSDQKRYMDNLRKPVQVSVLEIADRLESINNLTRYFPETQGNTLYTPSELKIVLHNMMPTTWKMEFAKSGHTFFGDEISYQCLTS